jgi:hypothetical protein
MGPLVADGLVGGEFCKMEIRPVFFKEILFFDFLAGLARILLSYVVLVWEGRIKRRDSSFPK